MKILSGNYLKLGALSILFLFSQCSSDNATSPNATTFPTVEQNFCTANSQVACSSLAGLWTGGTATCRSDSKGYDVSSCVRFGNSSKTATEVVYPAQRDSTRWGNAKCNKQGDFYFEITVPSHPNGGWEIQLEAGGFCAFNGDADGGCSNRPVELASNLTEAGGTMAPADKEVQNPTDDPDPDFGNMIHVKGHYCSSDMWSGTNTTGVPIKFDLDGKTTNWPFTGHINYTAMMDILQQRYGLHDDNPNLEILFRAGSAGAWGTTQNSWDMYARFPTPANSGKMMLSSWSAFVPTTWDNPNYPVFSGAQGQINELEAFKLLSTNWKSKFFSICAADHPDTPQICMFGPTMYDYITGDKSKNVGNMDLPLLVFQNRQDQLYMGLSALPPDYDGNSSQDKAARQSFVDQMNVAMGIDPAVPNKSTKIKWLYAVSDPDYTTSLTDASQAEPNVHPPLCYEFRSPGDFIKGSAKSLDHMYRDFWHTRGQGPGRGQVQGEVQTYNTNFVTLDTGDCSADGSED